jgi:hypothetical protein
MKPSSKKSAGSIKSRTKRAKAQLGQNTTKPLVLALAVRMLKTGSKGPATGRPTGQPIAKIKGNSVAGGAGAAQCGLIGDLADKAVDDMEQAIEDDDQKALDSAIETFQYLWDLGHNNGCYFSYV